MQGSEQDWQDLGEMKADIRHLRISFDRAVLLLETLPPKLQAVELDMVIVKPLALDYQRRRDMFFGIIIAVGAIGGCIGYLLSHIFA